MSKSLGQVRVCLAYSSKCVSVSRTQLLGIRALASTARVRARTSTSGRLRTEQMGQGLRDQSLPLPLWIPSQAGLFVQCVCVRCVCTGAPVRPRGVCVCVCVCVLQHPAVCLHPLRCFHLSLSPLPPCIFTLANRSSTPCAAAVCYPASSRCVCVCMCVCVCVCATAESATALAMKGNCPGLELN